jgi:hypothetical protein
LKPITANWSSGCGHPRPETAPARTGDQRGARAFVQNLHRGHYELATNIDSRHRLTAAFA